MSAPSQWFCALLDSASDVYFRFSLVPPRGFAYISPSVQALTGRTPAEFYEKRELCLALVAREERRLVRRLLRAGRGMSLTLHIERHGVSIPLDVRTVPVLRHRRIVAIEGVARLMLRAGTASTQHPGTLHPAPSTQHLEDPVQQRLTALMFEVHDLLHRVLPPAARAGTTLSPRVLRFGDLALDTDRLTVTESDRPVTLTTREVLVLRYLIERAGRVVTRQQLLTDVWSYSYTGDDRTVDVHLSRLRRKLPSLRSRLTAIRNIGYRLDQDEDAKSAAG